MPETAEDERTKPLSSMRVPWVDAARGFCIILVVVGHVIGGFRSANLLPEKGMLEYVNYSIFTFHMPAFFFLSGLFAAHSVETHSGKFLNNLFTKLAYPYFLWGVIQIVVMDLLGGLLNHPMSFDPWQFMGLVWGNVSQFWFLKTLFLFHISYFVFKKYSNDYMFLIMFIVLRGCSELVILPDTLARFSNFGMFYALAILFSQKPLDWPSRCRYPLLLASLFGAVWIVFVAAAMQESDPLGANEQLRGSLLPASILGTLFIIALSGSRYIERIRPLLYIGQRTLPIFLLHVFFVAGTRIGLVKILGVSDIDVVLLSAIVAGIVGPLAILELSKRFGVSRALGLS